MLLGVFSVLMVAVRILTVAAAFPALLFCIAYSRVNWRATAMGRHMMAFMGICAIILLLALLPLLFGRDYPGVDEVRLGAWAGINFIFWWRLVVLLKVILRRYPSQRCPHCGSIL